MTRLILDGTLFSECQLQGKNRHGMLRVAEEITKRLILNDQLDIAFSNPVYLNKYHQALKGYLTDYLNLNDSFLLSKKPLPIFSFLKYKSLFRKYPGLMFLPVKQKRLDEYELYHSFYQTIPKNIERARLKKSITFLDLIPLRMNGYAKNLVDTTRNIVKNIEKHYAISISEYSRNDLLDYNRNIHPDQVFTAPLAASTEVFFQNMDADQWQHVKAKYQLPDRYFLCISSSDFRKNIPHLIKGFSDFVLQEKPQDIYLLLAGNSTHSRSLLDQLNIDPSVRKYISFTDRFIDEEDLSVIYSRAMCFFFMSLYEGFGLPVLEAIQCGTPVISSNASSLPEVLGDAGMLIDPKDLNALSQSMADIYKDDQLRKTMSIRGIERSALFSWEKTTEAYIQIFNHIKSK